ncbi:LysR family transcriptional regulator [Sandaracinobacter sp. RS1-74]|uniref:LysR family transcriptional regulator n=1 Tax=Sandaracinobacteroides sayramensis TaxID=2913411 RepID=UPI001EDA6381|nr:LysR family transcriptional regulator [Sandaracinobacteroides sayramensis]MCG2840647.1 LysR family transcriptional regulator [Sandaracinobacteroides sayramensis]
MDRSRIPLNSLRAFEAAARHLSFTRAAEELCVTQAALSHQIKALEKRLGLTLFRRLPRGVMLTDEGAAIFPALRDSFDRIGNALGVLAGGQIREVVTLGVVSTFATGWLLPRLQEFAVRHPEVDLRILTNNNKPELAGEGLNFAIRFGDGSWHGVHSTPLLEAPLSVMCAPSLLPDLKAPADLLKHSLLRSYRAEEWPAWFAAAGLEAPRLTGPVFDTSLAIAKAVASGVGVGLLPPAMFKAELANRHLAMPFDKSIAMGRYWLTRFHIRPETAGMIAFRNWLVQSVNLV